MKYVPPSIAETAFNCPHCGALAKQFWSSAVADILKDNHKPLIIDEARRKEASFKDVEDEEERKKLEHWLVRMAKGRPFEDWVQDSVYSNTKIENLHFSSCFNCNDISIWIYDRLVWPQRGEGPNPNADLPEDVRTDYDEASTILNLSPRGAAALLRLCIQKLCKHLGEKGENINDDIKALVKKGLEVRLQRALDVVRVIGNNAVHPGQIDLRDDRATAETLFGLVNLIAEKMITEPKHVEELYGSLPESARKAIEKRDGTK